MIQYPMSHFTLSKKEDGGFILVAEASETFYSPEEPCVGESVPEIEEALSGAEGFAIKSNKTGQVRFFQKDMDIHTSEGEIGAWRFVDTIDPRNEVHLLNT